MPETKKELKVKVETRPETIYEGVAYSLSSINDVGKFDILPNHANFISIIQERLVIRKKDGSTHELPINQGILKASNNEVKVYLD
ncbi:MAG: hypothetical protein UV74_C0013G0020 [Candidatus Woesebacteria bacterium GW2011_GWB1_43_14]|uniref:ATP synthase F1 complex delta/epsilon subunit N-terminal domain-containing protein n=1 Tax=Candidatus Woesebacteria bacterium GW2011_GWB1_43_14 TaxID=1618578 RepID=A0A0G1GDD5_9BACT|nr:MAG: hypothetical protein UV51_C0009G0023 [Candidatus Woesebacteria bacterium GW2011_GWC1_42_9]KKS96898.1 MAG: hypothetical protein UV74_C0013G0020 [Candidatus Woesebacteria bacterium GW2011_GWB1_43_14]